MAMVTLTDAFAEMYGAWYMHPTSRRQRICLPVRSLSFFQYFSFILFIVYVSLSLSVDFFDFILILQDPSTIPIESLFDDGVL